MSSGGLFSFFFVLRVRSTTVVSQQTLLMNRISKAVLGVSVGGQELTDIKSCFLLSQYDRSSK